MTELVAQLSARIAILDWAESDVPAHGFLLSGISQILCRNQARAVAVQRRR